jgi:SNF2 family DNA or RNA helicase
MGLGKTCQALTALPPGSPVLVVCPAIVKHEWAAQARSWRPDYSVEILQGLSSFRWPEPGEIVITNYEILPRCSLEATRARQKGKITRACEAELKREARRVPQPHNHTIIIADEAHRLGRNKTLQTMRFRSLRTKAIRRDGRVWGLTGTPLENRPPELWNLLTSFQLHERAFGSWPRFRYAFNAIEGDYGIEWGESNRAEVVPAMRRVALRRLKTQVLPELPPKQYRTIPVTLNHQDRELCDAAAAELSEAGIDLDNATAEILASAAERLEFTTLAKARKALATVKLALAEQLVQEYEDQEVPLVVMSDHKHPVEVIGRRRNWGMIHGGASATDRSLAVERFQDRKLRGIAITIRAGGVGITLTRASDILRIDRNWTPAINMQAEDRCHRFGQAKCVTIVDMVADHPLDARVAKICVEKSGLMDTIDAMAVR